MRKSLAFLIVGISGGNGEFFCRCAQNRLLGIVGAIRQAAHVDLQANLILRFTHIGVNAQGGDLFCGGVEREGHLIAGLRIVGKNQVHGTRHWIYRHAASLVGLLHPLRIRGYIHSEDTLHILRVVLHFLLFLLNDSLLHPAAARLLRWWADGGLLHLAVRTVPAAILGRGFLLSFERQLRRFDPLILEEPLLVLGNGLLRSR